MSVSASTHALRSCIVESEILRYFQQIADGVTVTEVAELYQVSQPGVSRSLKRLEEEIGVALLERSGRILRPTHAGMVFKKHLDQALHALDDGLAAIDELTEPETGTVRIAFQPSLGAWLVPSMIASFRLKHPRVQFRLDQTHDRQGSAFVAEGRADLLFTARRPRNPDVEWERLVSQPLCLAVPPDHRLADRSEVALREAASDEFVMLQPTWELRGLAEELCESAGFSPAVAFEENDMLVVRGLVAAGLGVAIVPAPPGDGLHAHSGVERLIRLTDPAAFRDVGLAWSRERHLLPSAELFRRHAMAVARRTASST